MDDETARDMAVFRYGIIAPVACGFLAECSNEEFYRSAALKEYKLPDGSTERYKAGTIKKWHLAYRKHGLEALMPRSRNDAGVSRTISDEVGDRIQKYREQFPKITGQKIYEKLLEDRTLKYGETSIDSLYRYLNANGMSKGCMPQDECLAFEFEHANDCWQADTVDGPYIKVDGEKTKKKTYLISFIDDASRLHTHGEFFFNDNALNVQKVFKTAVKKAGIPKIVFDDNGGSYRNKQINWICAKLGVKLIHSKIYAPKGKGCIERSHRTAQMRFLDCTDFSDCHSLDDLNRRYWEYLRTDYTHKEHSGIGMSPMERYRMDYDRLRFMDEASLEEAFLHFAERKVTNDALVSLFKIRYEVPQRFIGLKISLRYNPEDLSEIYIYDETEHKRLAAVRPVNKVENKNRKRRKNMNYGENGEGTDV